MNIPSGPAGIGMPCPRCRVELVMSDRQGIEIDYCPGCRGVWLDRGELDKIVERNARYMAAPDPAPQPSAWTTPAQHFPQHAGAPPQQGPGYGGQQHYGGKRRKGGWLEELFD